MAHLLLQHLFGVSVVVGHQAGEHDVEDDPAAPHVNLQVTLECISPVYLAFQLYLLVLTLLPVYLVPVRISGATYNFDPQNVSEY